MCINIGLSVTYLAVQSYAPGAPLADQLVTKKRRLIRGDRRARERAFIVLLQLPSFRTTPVYRQLRHVIRCRESSSHIGTRAV